MLQRCLLRGKCLAKSTLTSMRFRRTTFRSLHRPLTRFKHQERFLDLDHGDAEYENEYIPAVLTEELKDESFMAHSFFELGHYEDSLEQYANILKKIETQYGWKHREYATLMINIGHNYLKLLQLDMAEKCFHEAYQIRKELDGLSHFSVASALKAYMDLHVHAKDYPKLINVCQESLLILNALLLELNPLDIEKRVTIESEKAIVYNYFGLAQFYLKNFEGAKKLWKDSIEICERNVSTENKLAVECLKKNYQNMIVVSKRFKEDEAVHKYTQALKGVGRQFPK